MSNSNNTPSSIIEVMQELSEKIRGPRGSLVSDPNGAVPLTQAPCLPPAPPTLHVTPVKAETAKRFEEVQQQAKQKTEVNRYIPKFLRRFFRRQGSFNREVLEIGRLLMKESSEANKRLREITAYLRAENGWFDGVMAAFAQVRHSLQRRMENQYSLEARLLSLENKIAEALTESRRKQQHLQENLESVVSAETQARKALEHGLDVVRSGLVGETKAREALEQNLSRHDGRLESLSAALEAIRTGLAVETKARDRALSGETQARKALEHGLDVVRSGLVGETKAREALEQNLTRHDGRLESLSAALEAIRTSLAVETKTRETVEERVRGLDVLLDSVSTTLDTVRQALAAEAETRQGLAARFDEERTAMTAMAKELSEKIRVTETGNDLLNHNLRAAEGVLSSMKDWLTRTEERQLAEASYFKRQLYVHSQSLAALQMSNRPTRARKSAAPLPSTQDRIEQHEFDNFYLAFENQFRGSRAQIKKRVRVYLPLIKKTRVGKRTSPVLDLGCGRGEWLEFLRDEGLVARGIDLNEFMVSECVERQLEVTQADVIQHLGTLSSDSQGAVTAFHLIEHLPFPILAKLVAESLRVLRPRGICIFETPNPDNVQVGSNRFYSDPTHLHPLPSDFVKFVMSAAGFRDLEVLPLHPDEDAVPLRDEAAPLERFVHEIFFGAQDYAVIGRK